MDGIAEQFSNRGSIIGRPKPYQLPHLNVLFLPVKNLQHIPRNTSPLTMPYNIDPSCISRLILFFDKVDILNKDRPLLNGGEGVLVVSNQNPLLCHEDFLGHDVFTIW